MIIGLTKGIACRISFFTNFKGDIRIVKHGTYDCETYYCSKCNREHEKIWIVYRTLVRTWGHWPIAHIGGKLTTIDGTVSFSMYPLPYDALELPEEIACQVWNSNAHYFLEGSPLVHKFIRDNKNKLLRRVKNKPRW